MVSTLNLNPKSEVNMSEIFNMMHVEDPPPRNWDDEWNPIDSNGFAPMEISMEEEQELLEPLRERLS